MPDAPAGPRILLVAPMTNWMFQNLVPSLRRLCREVCVYALGDNVNPWGHDDWPSARKRLVGRFLSETRALAAEDDVDFVLSMHLDDTLHAADVKTLRDNVAPVVAYHVDMNIQWYRILRQAPVLDLLAVSHMQNIEPFVRRGVPLHFMPMAASPDRCAHAAAHDDPPDGTAPDVLVLGSRNPNNELAIARCLEVTRDVHVYGSGWKKDDGTLPRRRHRTRSALDRLRKLAFDAPYLLPRLYAEGGWLRSNRWPRDVPADVRAGAERAHIHGYADGDHVASLMANAAVTIGVNQRLGNIGDRNGFADARLRDFEAPLAGAFYLVQQYVDLSLFYKPGVEVETWSSLDELARKLAYYLDHDDERRAIAAAGQARARAAHTWDARLADLSRRLGCEPRDDGAMCPLRVVGHASTRPWCAEAPGCTPTT